MTIRTISKSDMIIESNSLPTKALKKPRRKLLVKTSSGLDDSLKISVITTKDF
jgi:hypothetical protein